MKTIQIPPQFCFDLYQVSEIIGCEIQKTRDLTKKDPTSRYFLRARRNTQGGKQVVQYDDLLDYINRTYDDFDYQSQA